MTDYVDRRVTSPTWCPPLHVNRPLLNIRYLFAQMPWALIKFLDLERGRLFKVSTYSGLGANWTFTIFSKRNLIWQQNVKTFERHKYILLAEVSGFFQVWFLAFTKSFAPRTYAWLACYVPPFLSGNLIF